MPLASSELAVDDATLVVLDDEAVVGGYSTFRFFFNGGPTGENSIRNSGLVQQGKAHGLPSLSNKRWSGK